MRLNPFAVEKDTLQREINANLDVRRMDIAAGAHSAGVDEQIVLEQQKERSELTRWQQDLGDDIKIMIHRLRNEVQNPETGEWIPMKIMVNGKMEIARPICSEECIWRIVTLLEPSTSKNLIMSKYEKEGILNILKKLSDTLALDVLIPNRKKYGIRMSDLSLIMKIFQTAAGPTYYRALGANEKEYLKGIRKDTYLHTKGENEKKGLLNL